LRTSIDHPANDEIEISVFGPGYGEAILLHVGQGQWIAIDSCIDPVDPNQVVPLHYLQRLGVDCATKVTCIVATHWHDDHIRGLSDFLAVCPSARFCCATAFADKDFKKYALANSATDPSPIGNTTKEIVAIFKQLERSGRSGRFITSDRLLHTSSLDPRIELYALSPSDERVAQFISRVAAQLPKALQPMRRAPDLQPNDVAVALLLRLGNDSVLLGADLEEIPGNGWTMIVNDSQCIREPASVFKVAHHGSENGHCDAVWDQLLASNSIAVLTPWRRGGHSLPKESDVQRILGRTQNAYSTATPVSTSPSRRENAVERMLRVQRIKVRLAHPRPGHVRLRRKLNDAQWQVQTDGTATHLKHLLTSIGEL
jgi:beta-lactamase superfamily II metal-dependent hydrolase